MAPSICLRLQGLINKTLPNALNPAAHGMTGWAYAKRLCDTCALAIFLKMRGFWGVIKKLRQTNYWGGL
jgi:hypothetical protein